MTLPEITDAAILIAAAGAALGYFLASTLPGKRRAEAETDAERDSLITLLKEQRDATTKEVSELCTKMESLEKQMIRVMDWMEYLSCLNAPTCDRRDCPSRLTLNTLLVGEPIEA